MRHKLAFALFIMIGTAVALVPGHMRIASADSSLDCSTLKAINFDHRYKKGDLIWTSYGYTGPGYQRHCILDECYEKNADDSSAWKTDGGCKARPSGL
ncbi:MAG TPA: hypothetical protein VGG28_03205 [Kofleriaceae bacterium]|jgi:hypothetical protein